VRISSIAALDTTLASGVDGRGEGLGFLPRVTMRSIAAIASPQRRSRAG
jgi:hypothetical protein